MKNWVLSPHKFEQFLQTLLRNYRKDQPAIGREKARENVPNGPERNLNSNGRRRLNAI